MAWVTFSRSRQILLGLLGRLGREGVKLSVKINSSITCHMPSESFGEDVLDHFLSRLPSRPPIVPLKCRVRPTSYLACVNHHPDTTTTTLTPPKTALPQILVLTSSLPLSFPLFPSFLDVPIIEVPPSLLAPAFVDFDVEDDEVAAAVDA